MQHTEVYINEEYVKLFRKKYPFFRIRLTMPTYQKFSRRDVIQWITQRDVDKKLISVCGNIDLKWFLFMLK